jgi:serine protease Do
MHKPNVHPVKKLCLAVCLALSVAGMAAPTQVLAAPPVAVSGLPDLTGLVEQVAPAVVNIRTVEKIQIHRGLSDFDDYFFRFFGMPVPGMHQRHRPETEEQVRQGMGSGFIISEDGYILTNHHVINGADEVFVRLIDKREFKAKVIGSDKRTDVALLKVKGTNLPVLKTGRSADIKAGQWVLAIGSPFKLDNTVTAGIISATARDTGDYLPLIQTDVAVNPGNSGGPLINMNGEAIGINSQIFSRSGGYMGISFAVPIDEALQVADQLKKTGKVKRGQIGVHVSEINEETAKAMNLPNSRGILVAHVEEGSPAEKAGLEAGDVILKYNGHEVESASELSRLVGETPVGTDASVTVWRKGTNHTLSVRPKVMEGVKGDSKAAVKAVANNKSEKVLGVTVDELGDEQKKSLGVKHGVVITSAKKQALSVGLRRGDVIVRMNNADVTDVASFQQAVSSLERNKMVILMVVRSGMVTYVAFQPSVD